MYQLTITDSMMSTYTTYFTDLEEARAALSEKVRRPIQQYIDNMEDTSMKFIVEKLGRKKKAYRNVLPYDLITGPDYVAFYTEEGKYFGGGVIMELRAAIHLMEDNSHLAGISFEDDDED